MLLSCLTLYSSNHRCTYRNVDIGIAMALDLRRELEVRRADLEVILLPFQRESVRDASVL